MDRLLFIFRLVSQSSRSNHLDKGSEKELKSMLEIRQTDWLGWLVGITGFFFHFGLDRIQFSRAVKRPQRRRVNSSKSRFSS